MEDNFYNDMHFTPRSCDSGVVSLATSIVDVGAVGSNGSSLDVFGENVASSHLKRPVSLDLDGRSSNNGKKSRAFGNGNSLLLNSPDLNMLKLASPELERLIIQSNHGMVTTTPTPSSYYTNNGNKNGNGLMATEEQEQYARGFVDALAQMHNHPVAPVPCAGSNIPRPVITRSGVDVENAVTTTTATSCTMLEPTGNVSSQNAYHSSAPPPAYTSSANIMPPLSIIAPDYPPLCMPPEYIPHPPHHLSHSHIKEEPQTVPGIGLSEAPSPPVIYGGPSPPISPINMENQEKIKLERKRLRNRIAASKCRRKKIERIALLEARVNDLKNTNNGLSMHASQLREQIFHLQQEILDHAKNGCSIPVTFSALT